MPITFTEKYNNMVNRSSWAAGPWDVELDKAVWAHEGVDCMIKRNALGAWCGYVGVKKGQHLFGVEYYNVNTVDTDIHGGLTYSAECFGDICHQSEDGDHVWWFGFDCCHSFDFYPGDTRMFASPSHDDVSRYVTQQQVIAMVNAMAESVSKWTDFTKEEA